MSKYKITDLNFFVDTIKHIETKEHVLTFCDHCNRYMHVCKKCGNNTCNGMYGIVDNKTCTECKSAYEETNRYYSKAK